MQSLPLLPERQANVSLARHVRVTVTLLAAPALLLATPLVAQGPSTAAIRGAVTADDGSSVDGAQVSARNTGTGYVSRTEVRDGRFLLQGIEVGGPYVVEVRRIGFVPEVSRPTYVQLGEPVDLRFVMRRSAVQLEAVTVNASTSAISGSGVVITESLVSRLPTPNRNFYDLIALAPQISTKVGSQRSGVSAVGANLRFNNYLINGADERIVNGNVSAASNIGKSVPLDAVKEYQVLVAPYDVRFGDFAGALVNTVTRSGTNEFHGSAFTHWQNERLARRSAHAATAPYERLQYGFSAGGPVVRNRLHYFVAGELQQLNSPAAGPYVGQPVTAVPGVPVNAADLKRLERVMADSYGLIAGSGGPVQRRTPLRNMFGRVDLSLPRLSSRAVAFANWSGFSSDVFSRVARDTFYLSTYRFAGVNEQRLLSLQLFSDIPRLRGAQNELQITHVRDWTEQAPAVRQPLIRVVLPRVGGGDLLVNAGTAEAAMGRFGRSRSLTLKDELSLPIGAGHVLLLGARAEWFGIRRGGVNGGYGIWSFGSLAALESGTPDRYDLRKDFGSASAPLRGGQYSVYLGDTWLALDNVTITGGIRAEAMTFTAAAPYNALVDSIFGRRTDEMPRAQLHLSPRAGVTWQLSGTQPHRLRAGVGVFTGRPPRAWFVPAVTSYGFGIGVLGCGTRPRDSGPPPAFVANYATPPTRCATGPALETAPVGDVNLLDRNLRMAQSLRVSLAYDRAVAAGIVGTVEGLISRHPSDFMFANLNLVGPQGADRYGRVLYGAIGTDGLAVPAIVVGPSGTSSPFSEVIDLRNTSKNHSWQLSGRLERRSTDGFVAVASYTFSRTRDVQSPSRVNAPGLTLWGDARVLSGRHDDLTAETSLNDLPHRVVLGVGYSARWLRTAPTHFALYYVGESGGPFTYTAWGISRRGDLNADGSSANDPIYVPRSVTEPDEMLFSGFVTEPGGDNSPEAQLARIAAQQTAFESFISGSACLRRQRGRILARNSCREPWSHTSIASIRQSLTITNRVVESELSVFNVLNLLNSRWGQYRVHDPRLLEHVAHTAGGAESAQPIFRFNTARQQWTTLPTESAFQLQVALRYRF